MLASIQGAIEAAAQAAPQTEPVVVPTPVEGRVLIIDGDYLAYYAAGNDQTDMGTARRNAIDKMEAFKLWSGATHVVVHLTGSGSTKGDRFIAATVKPYQGQRPGTKPKNWRSLRDWLETYKGPAFKKKIWYDREADDGMAYHAKVLGPELAVIATADKDMRMFPAVHVDWHTYELVHLDAQTFRFVSPITGKVYGHAWFWQQMLMGDTADNIPGLPGYAKPNGKVGLLGEKTAAKLLAGCEDDSDAFTVVAGLYQGYYPEEWADRLVEQAALLWMREDSQASMNDWLRYDYGHAVVEAADRLTQRIAEAKAAVAELENVS